MKTILVTGATGNLGKATVPALVDKGFQVRAASRHPQPSSDSAVHNIRFDYTDPTTHRDALSGVDGVLLIAPPLDTESHSKLNPIIDLAKELGVRQIVLNSALGVDADEHAPIRVIERHLMNSGCNYTILRPNFFMENFTDGFLAPMVQEGTIHLAAADGKTSFISTKDIAAVAAEAFAGELFDQEYNLTGSEALDHTEVAQHISQAAGRTVTYHPITEEEMLQGAIRNGLPESAAGFMGVLYTVVRNGWAAKVTEDVQKVTNSTPLTFASFARQNAEIWK